MPMDNNFEENGSNGFAEENFSGQQNVNGTGMSNFPPPNTPYDMNNMQGRESVQLNFTQSADMDEQGQNPFTQQSMAYYGEQTMYDMPQNNAEQSNSVQNNSAPPNMQNIPNAGGYPTYPQNVPNLNQQQLNRFPQEKKKRAFTGGCFWTLISAIFVMFVIILLLAAAISMQESRQKESESKFNTENVQTQKAEHVEHIQIELPTVEKPVLDEEFYQDRETGLLTAVGVAEMILPSQVKIKVYDEMPYAPVSSGSGVIITADGYILTNAHVVDGARQLAVVFYDGSEAVGQIVGTDKKSDLAVISVEKEGLVPAEIGMSSSLVIGEEVAIAGAGGGFENTVTYGHVTGLDRKIDTDYMSSSTIHCIQSDAALNPGNSGGAMVNMYGQVVGIAVALMNHETYENIGFSIAIDDAVPIAEELIAYGYVTSRTRVGITYLSIGDAAAKGYGIMPGLCVVTIDPTSGAADSGLMPYDVVTEIDGIRVFGAEEVVEALADKKPGDTVMLTVFRKTVTEETSVFETEVVLSADMSSESGYAVNPTLEDYRERDIIR